VFGWDDIATALDYELSERLGAEILADLESGVVWEQTPAPKRNNHFVWIDLRREIVK
jgi:hypothetical protein